MPRLISSQRLKSRLSGEKAGEPGYELVEPALRDLERLHGSTSVAKSTTRQDVGKLVGRSGSPPGPAGLWPPGPLWAGQWGRASRRGEPGFQKGWWARA